MRYEVTIHDLHDRIEMERKGFEYQALEPLQKYIYNHFAELGQTHEECMRNATLLPRSSETD